jgi:hypothetical protein
MVGHPLRDLCEIDTETGEIMPVVTIVTDNGGPFRSFAFEHFITATPSSTTSAPGSRPPRQTGSRERGFGTLTYERLYHDEIDDALMLTTRTEEHRLEYNEIRPHEAIAWNPATGGTPRPGRPHHPHRRTRRNPANFLTRAAGLAAGPPPAPTARTGR